MARSGGSDVEAGFAKLQGVDFEYYMQTYSIVLGRNSKKSTVDVDLSSLGGGMNISRHHARIYYDFQRRRFALDVLGKNGCLVEGVLHLPGNPPVKLDSQDLLQIGDKEFYFLLPSRNILARNLAVRHGAYAPLSAPGGRSAVPYAASKKGKLKDYYEEEQKEDEEEEEEDDDDDDDDVALMRSRAAALPAPGGSGKKIRRVGNGVAGSSEKAADGISRVDQDADDHQPVQLELLIQHGNIWHHSKVRTYLASEEWPGPEAKGKPWDGLLMLLRRYPERFAINTSSKAHMTLEFVSLVSLLY
ncbi:hypothetical protein V2J09_016168 [Rumex salicifolius]